MIRTGRLAAAALCAVSVVLPAGPSGSGSKLAVHEGLVTETAAVLSVTRDATAQPRLSPVQPQLDPAVAP